VNDEILSDNPHLFLASFFFPLSFYFVSPPVCLFFLLTHTDLGLCTFLSLSLLLLPVFIRRYLYFFFSLPLVVCTGAFSLSSLSPISVFLSLVPAAE